MPKQKRVPLRAEIPQEQTWDLTVLFKSDQEWEKAFKKLEKQIAGFEQFRGRLGESAQVLRECYDFQTTFEQQSERVGMYASLKSSENVANDQYQGMVVRFVHMATLAGEMGSYIAPEIQAIPEKKMAQFLKSPELQPYRFSLEQLLRYKPHILSEKEERLLAMQGEIAEGPDRIFGQLNDADLKFGFVANERGENVELTQSSLRSLLESPRRNVRRDAFAKLYAQYNAHANTIAATYQASVLQDVYYSRVRNFQSARASALFGENIPPTVYDKLVEAVHGSLDTVYRYMQIRRKALRLKDIHFYDTYVPIVQSARRVTKYEDGVAMVCAALAPLGDEYCTTLRAGLLDGRWVDRFENEGKRSGAFSSGGYFGPPYILLNYRDDVLDSVFTLAHEAGHSMHTYLSAKNQPYQDYHYSIFVAEVASTFNEQLLNHYLLQKAKDKKTRAFLINREIDEIRGTIVRQTMFAEFEKITHALVEDGEPLTLERLREEYRTLLEAYFGPDFALDPELSLEALRIPHFYHAFYVYKYATGLSAAIALSERVLHGGAAERDAYLSFLKLGGSKYPLDALRVAGVDMERPEPVAMAMKRFEALVDEFETLV